MAEFLRSPQNNGIGKAEELIQGHSDVNSFNEQLYSEVLEEFTDWFLEVTPEDFDEVLLDAYLEEMNELSPLEGSFDSQASLEKIHKKFPSLFEEEKETSISNSLQMSKNKPHRRFGRLITVAATIAVMMTIMISAQAFGVDVFGFFAKWTSDIFFFDSRQNMIQEARVYPIAEGESAEYESIDDALSAFGVDLPLSPSWVPDYFGSWEVTGSVMPYGMRLFAFTKSESSVFTWEASEFSLQEGPTFIIEKSSEEVQRYESHGQVYYIVEDNGCYKATWTVDNIQCIISGFITKEELAKVIDSIYEVI